MPWGFLEPTISSRKPILEDIWSLRHSFTWEAHGSAKAWGIRYEQGCCGTRVELSFELILLSGSTRLDCWTSSRAWPPLRLSKRCFKEIIASATNVHARVHEPSMSESRSWIVTERTRIHTAISSKNRQIKTQVVPMKLAHSVIYGYISSSLLFRSLCP